MEEIGGKRTQPVQDKTSQAVHIHVQKRVAKLVLSFKSSEKYL